MGIFYIKNKFLLRSPFNLVPVIEVIPQSGPFIYISSLSNLFGIHHYTSTKI
jgi:hypothetical protein